MTGRNCHRRTREPVGRIEARRIIRIPQSSGYPVKRLKVTPRLSSLRFPPFPSHFHIFLHLNSSFTYLSKFNIYLHKSVTMVKAGKSHTSVSILHCYWPLSWLGPRSTVAGGPCVSRFEHLLSSTLNRQPITVSCSRARRYYKLEDDGKLQLAPCSLCCRMPVAGSKPRNIIG